MKISIRTTMSFILTLLVLGACSPQNNAEINTNAPVMPDNDNAMRFHMATIPDPYAGLENPTSTDEESIASGQEIYVTNCAVCHGDGGMGDGPAGLGLDPAPAAIAHTSQMMSDGYLFWRISEGGSSFGTAMIPFKGTVTEEGRWDVINYIRALGANQVLPQEQFGGEVNDPAIQAAQQAEMLTAAVTQNVITQEEADLFAALHTTIDEFIENNRAELNDSNKPIMESGLDAISSQGIISEEEAAQFLDIHNRLLDAGLMQ